MGSADATEGSGAAKILLGAGGTAAAGDDTADITPDTGVGVVTGAGTETAVGMLIDSGEMTGSVMAAFGASRSAPNPVFPIAVALFTVVVLCSAV